MIRRRIPGPHRAAWAVVLPALLLMVSGAAHGQGVRVGLVPSALTVVPGAEFDLEIAVTEAGSLFNGYDATITYDPAALTFLPTSPTSLQQGSYMLGECFDPPSNPSQTFHQFSSSAGSLTINHVRLCRSPAALPGPGQLYKLHFQASTTEQVTTVRFGSVQFYQDGLFVAPVSSTDATIGIGVALDVGGPGRGPRGLRLSSAPNPFRTQAGITVESASAGWQELRVSDPQGRVVRHLEGGTFGAGTRRVIWDGRDDWGRVLPSGVYLVSARGQTGSARIRLALLR